MPDHGSAARDLEIIAHRGFSARAPENTMAAIHAAIEHGADAVEFDVHVTSDGVPVLFHDDTLERTSSGSGLLRQQSYVELARLDAGSWFSAEFAGEPIPSFETALASIDGRARIYPEVKGYRAPEDLDAMVDMVLAHSLEERTVFISMDWLALDRIRKRHEGLWVGLIVETARRAADAFERAHDDTRALLDFKAALLLADPALAGRAVSAGVDLAVWTVDDPHEAEKLVGMGVRRITTNRVEELVAWRAS